MNGKLFNSRVKTFIDLKYIKHLDEWYSFEKDNNLNSFVEFFSQARIIVFENGCGGGGGGESSPKS